MSIEQLTIGQVTGYFRDVSVGVGILTVAWKARGVWEECKSFIASIRTFMDSISSRIERVDDNVETLLKNHFAHIERDIQTLREALAKQAENTEEKES